MKSPLHSYPSMPVQRVELNRIERCTRCRAALTADGLHSDSGAETCDWPEGEA